MVFTAANCVCHGPAYVEALNSLRCKSITVRCIDSALWRKLAGVVKSGTAATDLLDLYTEIKSYYDRHSFALKQDLKREMMLVLTNLRADCLYIRLKNISDEAGEGLQHDALCRRE